MPGPDPATTEWVPVWNPVAVGPVGPMGPQGPAGGAVASAKYWVVEPFGGLVNARALNGLGNGYVKSTVGEPSVVATIPLTDTTGILPDNRLTSNVALGNRTVNFTVNQQLPSDTYIYGTGSAFMFWHPGAPLNHKIWRWINYSDGTLRLEKLTDDFTAATANFYFQANGMFFASLLGGDASNVTNLNASQLAFGTVPLARLGTNAPNNTLFLRGDNTWQAPSGFPSGLIVISDSPCPIGWSRVVWDGLFLRSGPTIGVQGGANTHSHGSGSYFAADHGHGGAGVNIGVTVNGTTTTNGFHDHGYSVHMELNTGDDSGGEVNGDAGNSHTISRGPHNHHVSIHMDAPTTGNGDHAHTVTSTGSAVGNTGSIPGSGNIGVFGNSSDASSLPPFLDIYYCRKN